MHPKHSSFFLAFIFRVTDASNAQFEDSSFVRYTIKNGPGDNYITAIQQDHWGYSWIGADNGLNRLLNEKHRLKSSVTIADKKNIAGATGTGTIVTLHLSLEMKWHE